MYILYGTILVILLLILIVLYREEWRLRLGISQGKLEHYLILKERRRYVRFKTDIPVHYRILHNDSNLMQDMRIKDISKAGLGLVIYEKLRLGELLEISFKVPDFERSVKAIGQVIWIKEKGPEAESDGKRSFSAGLKFKRLDVDSEAFLILYISKLKTKK